MNQASAAALNTNVAYEQQFNTVGFDKDDHWNRGRSDEDKDWKKPPPPRDDDRDDKRPPRHDRDDDDWTPPPFTISIAKAIVCSFSMYFSLCVLSLVPK